jgi:hypothetical protein
MKLAELSERAEMALEEHLDVEALVPVTDGLQAQGDLNVIPLGTAEDNGASIRKGAKWGDVPAKGIVVLAGTHEHVLVADSGTCQWTPDVADSTNLALGALVCDRPAYLLHTEHGGVGLAPGSYILRGTREQADEIRRVAD